MIIASPIPAAVVSLALAVLHYFLWNSTCRSRRIGVTLIISSYSIIMAVLLYSFHVYLSTEHGNTLVLEEFMNLFCADALSYYVSLATSTTSILVLLQFIARSELKELRRLNNYISLVFILVAIIFAMVTTYNMATLVVLWEGVAIGSLGLIAYKARRLESESLIKMVLMTALSSLLLTAGIGILYVALSYTYESALAMELLNFDIVHEGLENLSGESALLAITACALILSGLIIEMGAFPFYMWLVDVYTGARYWSLALMVLLLEVSIMYPLSRVFGAISSIFTPEILGVPSMIILLSLIALSSILLGETCAFTQSRLRRIIGYSAVADAGYILLMILLLMVFKRLPLGMEVHNAAPLAYFILMSNVSLATSALAIGILEEHGIYTLDNAKGLVRKCPSVAVILAISLMSLLGVPPLAGFLAKFMVISSLANTQKPVIVAVATIAAALFVVAAAYCIRILQHIFIEPPSEEVSKMPPLEYKLLIPMFLLVLLLLVGGVAPWIFLQFFP